MPSISDRPNGVRAAPSRRLATAIAIGSIIIVVAVLLSHIDRKAVAAMKPKMIRS